MSAPLRVVIDVRVGPASGGVQQWVIGLAHALSGLEASTEEYIFLVDQNSDWLRPYVSGQCRLLTRPLADSVKSGWIARARHEIAAAAPIVRDVWRRVGPRRGLLDRSDGSVELLEADVVHFPQQAAYLTDIPTIYQPWDLQHAHLPEFFTAQEHEFREKTYRAYCEQARLVITATEWVKRDVADQYAIPPERIAVVNVPPPTQAYTEPTPAEVQAITAQLGLPAEFLFYPAQAWEHKNHARLFEALALLRREGLTVPLVCSGFPNEKQAELTSHVERLGTAADVYFVGFVDPKTLLTLYHQARGLVFPSLYEGWGLPVVEAFAHGLPVACSNVTSLPELVGDAALVFDPYDPADIAAAIRKLWTDEDLSRELARRGRAIVQRFSWHRTAQLIRAHYRRIAGRRLDQVDLELLGAASVT